MIGIAAAKFLLLGLVLSNYDTIFRSVNGAFNQVAAAISPNDWASNWMLQVNQYFNGLGNASWFNLVVSSIVALISVLVQLIAAVVFPIALLIFTILYCLYGAVLYAVGPLVLALYPAFGVGQLARSYLVNLFMFHAWGIVYALFSVLLTAINADSLARDAGRQQPWGMVPGRQHGASDVAGEHSVCGHGCADSVSRQADCDRRDRQFHDDDHLHRQLGVGRRVQEVAWR